MFHWRGEFSIPGLPLAQPLKLGAIYVERSPRAEDGKYEAIGHVSFEAEQYLCESDARARAVSLLEPVAVAGAALGGWVGEPVVTSVSLENRDVLEASGVRIPFEGGLLVTWTEGAADIECSSLTKGYLAVVGLGPEEAPLWHRAARWLWKSNWQADPYDQLLAVWIPFNVLYGPKWTGSEPQAIADYLAGVIPEESDAAKLLVGMWDELQLLAASSLTLGRGKRWLVADELQTALGLPEAERSHRELVRLVCLVMYSVRCDIVHQGGASINADSMRLLWAGRDVLKRVVMFLLRRRLGLED